MYISSDTNLLDTTMEVKPNYFPKWNNKWTFNTEHIFFFYTNTNITFLEISCNVWNIYINIFPYK